MKIRPVEARLNSEHLRMYQESLEKFIFSRFDTSQLMHNVCAEDLKEKDARIVLALKNDHVIAGGYTYITQGNHLYYGGVYINPEYSGQNVGRDLVAHMRFDAYHQGVPSKEYAITRILPNDIRNVPAERAFLANGFHRTEIVSHKLKGTDQDRHLIATANENGEYKTQQFESKPSSFYMSYCLINHRGVAI